MARGRGRQLSSNGQVQTQKELLYSKNAYASTRINAGSKASLKSVTGGAAPELASFVTSSEKGQTHNARLI